MLQEYSGGVSGSTKALSNVLSITRDNKICALTGNGKPGNFKHIKCFAQWMRNIGHQIVSTDRNKSGLILTLALSKNRNNSQMFIHRALNSTEGVKSFFFNPVVSARSCASYSKQLSAVITLLPKQHIKKKNTWKLERFTQLMLTKSNSMNKIRPKKKKKTLIPFHQIDFLKWTCCPLLQVQYCNDKTFKNLIPQNYSAHLWSELGA